MSRRRSRYIERLRAMAKSEGTEFNTVVYGMNDMAKQTVSTRLRKPIAEQVERYAETHEISRTEAMMIFAREGLENPDSEGENRAYTGVVQDITEERGYWDGETPGTVSVEDHIRGGLAKLADTDPDWWEIEEEEPRSARMPQILVGRLDERAQSQDSTRSEVAAEAIERGVKADPIPDDARASRDGDVYTIELDPETAELFRRYRLANRLHPGEVFEKALNWGSASGGRSVPVVW